MLRVFVALFCLLVSAPALAQDVFPPRQTTTPPDARFELLSGSYGGGRTYRLDRWTGQVAELDTKHQNPTWHACEIKDATPDTSWTSPRYQLITTGSFSSEILLVDTLTGRTWIKTFGEEITFGRRDYRSVWVPLK